jgi:hypothetical protein
MKRNERPSQCTLPGWAAGAALGAVERGIRLSRAIPRSAALTQNTLRIEIIQPRCRLCSESHDQGRETLVEHPCALRCAPIRFHPWWPTMGQRRELRVSGSRAGDV